MAQPFPFTLANLPAGNNPVSDIDANFAVCVRGPTTTVNGRVPYWDGVAGVSQAAGYPTLPGFGTLVSLVGVDVSNQLPAVSAALLTNIPAGIVYNYLGGLTLSNDSGTPNTILDIAAGTAADSANGVMITLLTAFTKTTAGSWAAGTGNAGMGAGLTIANTTWYHVFAITNTGAADVYFDTSVTAANAPVGTTAHRRIGSFLTDGSAHIIAFIQVGNQFLWSVPVTNVNTTTSATAALVTLTVPLGVAVTAITNWYLSIGATGCFVILTDPAQADTAPSITLFSFGVGGNASSVSACGQQNIATNTSSQIRIRSSHAGDTVANTTMGWIDNRGM